MSDLSSHVLVQLEEFRKKKEKSTHPAASVQETDNETSEEEARPDPNIWRRALEVTLSNSMTVHELPVTAMCILCHDNSRSTLILSLHYPLK